jgi:hypothetical protein
MLFTYGEERTKPRLVHDRSLPASRLPPRVRSTVDLARSVRRFDHLLLLLALSSFLVPLGTWSAQPGLFPRARSDGPGLRYEGAGAPGARLFIACSSLCGMGVTGERRGARARCIVSCCSASVSSP